MNMIRLAMQNLNKPAVSTKTPEVHSPRISKLLGLVGPFLELTSPIFVGSPTSGLELALLGTWACLAGPREPLLACERPQSLACAYPPSIVSLAAIIGGTTSHHIKTPRVHGTGTENLVSTDYHP